MFLSGALQSLFQSVERTRNLVTANDENLSAISLQELFPMARQILEFSVQHLRLPLGNPCDLHAEYTMSR